MLLRAVKQATASMAVASSYPGVGRRGARIEIEA